MTTLQGIVTVAAKSERWVGHWPNSSAVVGWATLWGACLAAGVAAWVVAAPRKGQYSQMLATASRPQGQVYGLALAAVGGGSLTGYLAVLGYVVQRTAPHATEGSLAVAELLPVAAWVVMAVGLGAAVGKLAPPMLAPILAALGPYLVYMWAIYADVYANRTFFSDLLAMDDSARDYLRLPTELLVAKAVMWACVGAALLLWVLRMRRASYVSTVAAGVAAAAAFLVAGVRVDVPRAYEAVCWSGAPRVCVDRAHHHIGQQYRRHVVAALGRLGAEMSTGVTVMQSAELFALAEKFTGTGDTAPTPVRLVVPVASRNTSPAHEIDPDRLTADTGFAVFLAPCLSHRAEQGHAGTQTGQRAAVALYHWWLSMHGLPTDGSNYPGEVATGPALAENPALAEFARQFGAMSDDSRVAWLAKRRPALLSCRLEPLA
ncbi:MAG TPA: hypothetical protein VNV66_17055 [Pilimelia sp.]|nr:hypothetical protein [Pilimelia sp.]